MELVFHVFYTPCESLNHASLRIMSQKTTFQDQILN